MTAIDTRAPLPEPTTAINLRRVLEIRLVMLAICMAALLFAEQLLQLALPLPALSALIGVTFALTGVYRWRIGRRTPNPSQGAMTLQLLFDIGILTAILHLTGGWTNPLVSLYLVPIAVAATLLPRATTWLIAAAAALAYTAMTRFFRPIFDLHHGGDDFALHVTGMWLTFVIAGALLAFFGSRFTETLRRRDQALAEAREANLRNEQIMGIATLAAGTAHELATPLATIAVIAAELEASTDPATREDLAELSRQIAVCREILDRLRSAATPQVTQRSCRDFLADVAERFQLLHPAVPLRQALPPAAQDREIDDEPVLHQAVLNLLDNAARVSPSGIELVGRLAGATLEIEILDHGRGFSEPVTVANGLGMGLVLTNATIERRGGRVFAASRAGGGTCVRVVLPLSGHDPAP